MPTSARTRVLYLIGFAVLLAVYGYHLGFPSEPYFDEVHYVKFVRDLVYHNHYFGQANTHPPLWHLCVALSVEIFGDHAWAWRIVSLLAHFGVMYLTFRLAEKITGDRNLACLALFLLIFDGLSLTQARVAMMNSLMVLFILMCLYSLLGAANAPPPGHRVKFRVAGMCWALAVATKLVALNLAFCLFPLLILGAVKRPADRIPIILDGIVYFLILPIVMVLGVHIFAPFLRDGTVADIWKIPYYNIQYHMKTHQVHGYASHWWGWPLMLRPTSYYFTAHNWGTPGATCETILAIGNPAVFWMIPLATLHSLWVLIRHKSRTHGLILLGFLSQWVSFALMGRMQFFHYFYQAMPFVVMMLAAMLVRIYNCGRWGRVCIIVYLILVAGMFVYWYPIWIGQTIPCSYFYKHMWFRSWI